MYVSVILSFLVSDSTTPPWWWTFSTDMIFHMQSACYCTFTGKCRALCLCVCTHVHLYMISPTAACSAFRHRINRTKDFAAHSKFMHIPFRSLLVLRMAFLGEDPLPILSSNFDSVRNHKGKSRKIPPETQLSQCPPFLPSNISIASLMRRFQGQVTQCLAVSQHRLRGQHEAHSEHQSNLSNTTFPLLKHSLISQDHHTSTHSSTCTPPTPHPALEDPLPEHSHISGGPAEFCWGSLWPGSVEVNHYKSCALFSLCKSQGAQSLCTPCGSCPFTPSQSDAHCMAQQVWPLC